MHPSALLVGLALPAVLVSAAHYPALGLHNDHQEGLVINGVPAADRMHWMRIANVREINGDPCGIAPFGVAVVNTTSNELVCVAANRVGSTGNPTQHGEITGLDVCSEVLRKKGLSPKEMLAAWKSFTMYTNGEPCPMCASALRWAGIGEVVWGTSIETIIRGGRSQIYLPSSLIVSASYSLGHQSLWLGSVLSEETDRNFLYQFNESYPCPSHASTSASPSPNAESDDDDEVNDDSVWWTPSELRDILDRSTQFKVQGNDLFGKGNFESALESYREGLVELPVRTAVSVVKGKGKADEEDELVTAVEEVSLEEKKGEEKEEEGEAPEEVKEGEEVELRELRAVLFANVAACLIKLERWKDAVQACDDALEDNPTYIKALSRRATASEAIGSWSSLSSALSDYKTLSTLPGITPLVAKSVKLAETRLPPLIAVQQDKEKDEVLAKLKELGNTVLGKFGMNTDMFKFAEQPGGGYGMSFER
ncbi:hypothetical protein RQP46_003012 [Phenoliferia psychrophenolica]